MQSAITSAVMKAKPLIAFGDPEVCAETGIGPHIIGNMVADGLSSSGVPDFDPARDKATHGPVDVQSLDPVPGVPTDGYNIMPGTPVVDVGALSILGGGDLPSPSVSISGSAAECAGGVRGHRGVPIPTPNPLRTDPNGLGELGLSQPWQSYLNEQRQSITDDLAPLTAGLTDTKMGALGFEIPDANAPFADSPWLGDYPGVRGLLTLISHVGETPDAAARNMSNYDVPYGYTQRLPKELTTMTIAAVMQTQLEHGLPDPMGAYGFMYTTLGTELKNLHLDGSEILDSDWQDSLAVDRLVSRHLPEYINNQITADQFQHNLALEWDSIQDQKKSVELGVPASAQGHTGPNAVRITTEMIQKAIANIPQKPKPK